MENQKTIQVNPEDYKKRDMPIKPQVVIDYYNLPVETRKKMNENPDDYREFWMGPEIRRYFDKLNENKNMNCMNRKFLLGLKKEGVIDLRIDKVLGGFSPSDYLINYELRGRTEDSEAQW